MRIVPKQLVSQYRAAYAAVLLSCRPLIMQYEPWMDKLTVPFVQIAHLRGSHGCLLIDCLKSICYNVGPSSQTEIREESSSLDPLSVILDLQCFAKKLDFFVFYLIKLVHLAKGFEL